MGTIVVQKYGLVAAAAMMGMFAMSANASEAVLLHAAGSLRGALSEISQAFEKSLGLKVQAKFGPSGLLKDEIAAGGKAEVFASANMEHPMALAKAGKSAPVVLFARNKLCAAGSPRPRRDQRYAARTHARSPNQIGNIDPKSRSVRRLRFEAFRKAEAVRPNARATLEKKALQLTGGAASAAVPAGRNPYGWHIAEGRADIFLAYCTAARDARKENPDLQTVALPDALAVSADYGLTVTNDASPGAYQICIVHPVV